MQTSAQTFFGKKLLEIYFSIFYSKYGVGDGLAKQNLHFKLYRIYRLYCNHKGLIFLALTSSILCKNYMNNSYTFLFLTGIIYFYNSIMTEAPII